MSGDVTRPLIDPTTLEAHPSDRTMNRIVRRLVDVEQPWNCPHGRPTMRHLVDMKQLLADQAEVEPFW